MSIEIPPQLLSLLLPLLNQPVAPPQAFWAHTDGQLHPLLTAHLAAFRLPPPAPAHAYASVDTLEFPSPKAFLADVYRQWRLPVDDLRPADRGSWEHFLDALERSASGRSGAADAPEGDVAAAASEGRPAQVASRVLVVDHAEGLKFTPGGLGGLLLGLSEMVRPQPPRACARQRRATLTRPRRTGCHTTRSQTKTASVMVVFLSSIPWDYVRPIPSSFPDPVYLSLPAFSQTRASPAPTCCLEPEPRR